MYSDRDFVASSEYETAGCARLTQREHGTHRSVDTLIGPPQRSRVRPSLASTPRPDQINSATRSRGTRGMCARREARFTGFPWRRATPVRLAHAASDAAQTRKNARLCIDIAGERGGGPVSRALREPAEQSGRNGSARRRPERRGQCGARRSSPTHRHTQRRIRWGHSFPEVAC